LVLHVESAEKASSMRAVWCLLALFLLVQSADGQRSIGKLSSSEGRQKLKAKSSVAEWYCKDGANSAELPCANYEFLKQLRAAPNAADKKAMVMQRLKDRQARMKDKASAATNRAAYLKMYKAYCENGHSTEAICTRYIKKTGTGAGLKA